MNVFFMNLQFINIIGIKNKRVCQGRNYLNILKK